VAKIVLFLALIGTIAAPLHARGDEGIAYFEKHVRPVLLRRCYGCHSQTTKQEGSLRLDIRDGWQHGGDSGPAIVPGKPDESLLVEAIRYESLEMPPKGQLPAAEIDVLVKWIAMGAPDPRDGKTNTAAADYAALASHWSFQPLRDVEPPAVKNLRWPTSEIDRFVLARLEEHKLQPSSRASALDLFRRVKFDLVGLPLTLDEIAAIERDGSPTAYEQFVDELLASRHYGERWARHWLDLVRYAESVDLNSYVLRDAWRYRDYVIEALNHDLPYDQFVREQLAGDLLPAPSAAQRDRQTIATGMLAMGPFAHTVDNPQEHMDSIDEQIDVVTQTFMGLTVACARCHDHKFDPIPTTDYYALAGIFGSTDLRRTIVHAKGKHTFVRLETGVPLDGYEQQTVDLYARNVEDRYADGHAHLRLGWALNKLQDERKTASGEQLAEIERQIAKIQADRREREERARRARQQPPVELPPMALGVSDGRARNVRVHIRGDVEDLGPEVPRGFVRVVSRSEAPEIPAGESGRKQLAQWLTDGQHPLTSRVMVNRIWLHLFQQGLVRSPNNFGVGGESPSHPELLDYLAGDFQAGGWSIKRLVRKIVVSSTYCQAVASSAAAEQIDGDNVLLWRQNRKRLETEPLRDAILAFSGTLDLSPAQGSQLSEFDFPANLRYQRELINFAITQRSIYLPAPRNFAPPLYDLFDHVDTGVTTGQRNVTTVPLQSLFMLNSPLVREQAAAAAARVRALDEPSSAKRIDWLFRQALGRRATESDLRVAQQLLDHVRMSYRGVGNDDVEDVAWSALCQALIGSPEFRYVQ
jgi:hypothetical protein